MVVWGIISAATAECKTYGGLLAVRFFLGFVEAAYFPGCLYYLSCWYTRKELGLRTSYLYSGAIISGAFSGLISAGITGNMDGARGLGAWQWLFLIEGVVTVAVAFVAYFVLPNFPRTTSWLSEEEREMAIWRLQEDIGEDDWQSSGEQKMMHGFTEALKDIKTWILVGELAIADTLATGVLTMKTVGLDLWHCGIGIHNQLLPNCRGHSSIQPCWCPLVYASGQPGANHSQVISLLLTSPPYILCFFTMCANAWHADRTGERFFHITIPLCVGIAANILAAATKATAPRYVAMMLIVPGVYTGYTTALAWISNTLPRPPAKRAAALAFINAVSNCASIYASYLYPSSAGPQYTGAFIRKSRPRHLPAYDVL
jgi:MFS family permease